MIAVYDKQTFNLDKFVSWCVKRHTAQGYGGTSTFSVVLITTENNEIQREAFCDEEDATELWKYLNKISAGTIPSGTPYTLYLKDEYL